MGKIIRLCSICYNVYHGLSQRLNTYFNPWNTVFTVMGSNHAVPHNLGNLVRLTNLSMVLQATVSQLKSQRVNGVAHCNSQGL
jgi:hypothetical protein